ncbi:MAG: zf-HC2 domain-containing protein [Lachnospiraceae bacterium]|nr:zf-HC2 domain-containing protein [Lachnospiraceae bacterium]
MTCMEAEKMVIPYINDKLPVSELEDFIEHIESCENCREELEIHYMVDVGLKKLDDDDATYDIVGDLKRKLEDSARLIRRYAALEVTRYAVNTLMSMAMIVMLLLQIRIWHQTGFLFF